jgi:hypothetical protein
MILISKLTWLFIIWKKYNLALQTTKTWNLTPKLPSLLILWRCIRDYPCLVFQKTEQKKIIGKIWPSFWLWENKRWNEWMVFLRLTFKENATFTSATQHTHNTHTTIPHMRVGFMWGIVVCVLCGWCTGIKHRLLMS